MASNKRSSRFGSDLLGTFVVKRHKGLDSEVVNMEVLHMRNDVLADNILINSGAGGICLVKVLNDGNVNCVANLVDDFGIMFLSSTNDNICQKVYGVSEK